MREEDALRLLRPLLEQEGAEWTEECGWLRFRAKHGAMEWETDCIPCGDALLIYSRLPLRCADRDRALRACDALNRRLAAGALFLERDGSPVYRCRALLDDVYGAQERIAAALRESARVIAHCWGQFSGL